MSAERPLQPKERPNRCAALTVASGNSDISHQRPTWSSTGISQASFPIFYGILISFQLFASRPLPFCNSPRIIAMSSDRRLLEHIWDVETALGKKKGLDQ
jgi:hypothetical protein